MKQKQAQKLRDAWGDSACTHVALSREYDGEGQRTGNYICTQCGRTLTFRERAEWLSAKGDAADSL